MKQDRELFFTTDGTCNRRIVFKGIMTMRYQIIILEQLLSSTSEYDTDGDGIPDNLDRYNSETMDE